MATGDLILMMVNPSADLDIKAISMGLDGQVLTLVAGVPVWRYAPRLVGNIAFENPVLGDKVGSWRAPVAITITGIHAVLVGSATPSVTYKLRFGTDRSAAGTAVVTAGSTVTSVTAGDDVTSFDDATIPANSWVWIEVTAQSGTVTQISVNFEYTED